MKLIRPKGIIDKKQLRTFYQNHSKIISFLDKAPEGLTRGELKSITGLSYATIRKHLKHLIKNLQVIERGQILVLRPHYIERVGKSLKVLTGELQTIIEAASKAENIRKMKKEGTPPHWVLGLPERIPVNTDPDAPATTTFLTKDEWLEFYEHREKVYGGLRRAFFDLAKIVMKVDVGFIDAEEDLSNVTTQYRNRRAVWSVDASIKPQTHIMLKDGDE